jgi:hypothetical protein
MSNPFTYTYGKGKSSKTKGIFMNHFKAITLAITLTLWAAPSFAASLICNYKAGNPPHSGSGAIPQLTLTVNSTISISISAYGGEDGAEWDNMPFIAQTSNFSLFTGMNADTGGVPLVTPQSVLIESTLLKADGGDHTVKGTLLWENYSFLLPAVAPFFTEYECN